MALEGPTEGVSFTVIIIIAATGMEYREKMARSLATRERRNPPSLAATGSLARREH